MNTAASGSGGRDERGGSSVVLAARAREVAPYTPPPPDDCVDLNLASNECAVPAIDLERVRARLSCGSLTRYPDSGGLESALAARWGVDRGRVLVTAGGDDAIDRLCRVMLEPGRTLIFPWPSFEMIERSARAAGGAVVRTPWRRGPFPAEHVASLVSDDTAMAVMVSPNNPTGLTATPEDLERVAAALRRVGGVVLVDLAYAEFAGAGGEALMQTALRLDNTVIIRTFSKAYGLAGMRVGYAIGPSPVVRAMRALGGPYPTSSIALAAATELVSQGSPTLDTTIGRVLEERAGLTALMAGLGGSPTPSQGNFVLGEFRDSGWVVDGLRSLGIAVRRLTIEPGAGGAAVRITCPGSAEAFARLDLGLRAVLRPEALVIARVGRPDGASRPFEPPIPAAIIDGEFTPDELCSAADRLRVRTAWAVCASADAVRAARAASSTRLALVPIGLAPSGDFGSAQAEALTAAGAARVIPNIEALEGLLT